jgi:hypothetical protein
VGHSNRIEETQLDYILHLVDCWLGQVVNISDWPPGLAMANHEAFCFIDQGEVEIAGLLLK